MAKIIITEFEFSEVKLGQNSSASRSYPKQSKVSDLLKLLQFASKIASKFLHNFQTGSRILRTLLKERGEYVVQKTFCLIFQAPLEKEKVDQNS